MNKLKVTISFLILLIFFSFSLFSCSNNKHENENNVAIKNNDSANVLIDQQPENPFSNAELKIKVFKNDTVAGSLLQGFGYDVYLNNKLYLHQPNIPAVSGNNGFNTAEQAEKTGQFIAYKIKNNILPPSITPQELDSLGVIE